MRAHTLRPRRSVLVLLLSLLCLPLAAGCVFENIADEREFVSGPTNINAAVGNGGLSAALSGRGEVTVLRWPSPSYHDQLNYRTAILTPGARDLPRMGAEENMGVFAGLVCGRRGGTEVTWLRDDPWESVQTYLSDASNTVCTRHRRPDLGLEVRSLAWVLPDRDVLALRCEVRREEGSDVDAASLLLFENLAPCLDRIPNLFSVTDWLLDFLNDFAALYDARSDTIVHFRPEGGAALLERLDPVLLDPAPDMVGAVQDLVDTLDETFGQGVYVAIGSSRRSAGHQVGFDTVAVCDTPRPWNHDAEDAFLDAGDGTLAGSPAAGCHANAALRWDLDLSSGSDALTVYLAFAPAWRGQEGALALLESARAVPDEAHLAETERWWASWLGRARMPRTTDADLLRVCKRALISVKTAADRNTGAIVASISTQPPYSLDWPRDGAFINEALDRAGYHDMVTRHNLFYARVQRKEPLLDPRGERIAPAGTYATNYYADGMEGWPIPFEIDNAALAAWSMAEHARFLAGRARADYLERIWPALRLTAEELAACRDPENGLQCLANEGDSADLTQGLPGAVSVYTALDAALDAGAEVGAGPSLLAGWRSRRDELKEAILTLLWNEEGYFETGFPYPRGFVSWVIWPARLLPYDDPRMQSHAEHMLGFIEPHLRKETPYALYDAEAVSALARIWRDDPRYRERVRWALEVLAREVPTPRTGHYSEVYTVAEGEAGKSFVQRTGIPHVWSASLVYLAAMEATDTGSAPDGGNPLAGDGGGCGCRTASRGPRPAMEGAVNGLVYLLPALWMFRRSRRVRARAQARPRPSRTS